MYLFQASLQTHNKLMNKILLVSEKDLQPTIREILSHFLQLAQIKNLTSTVIGLLTKFIEFLKFYQRVLAGKNKKRQLSETYTQTANNQQEKTTVILKKTLGTRKQLAQIINNHNPEQIIPQILTQVFDIILLIQNRAKSGDGDTFLRIIQTTFSIIDVQFIQYMSYVLLTKIYSISFQCCLVNVMIQNISVSCLFSLTQTLFSLQKKETQAHLILQNFLGFLFRNKKFSWIKDGELNGLVWDLVISGIKNQRQQGLGTFIQKQQNLHLINLMYKISAQKAFRSKVSQQKLSSSKQSTKKSTSSQMSITFRHDPASQFIRCYKAFIILSIRYSLAYIQSQPEKQEIVPFKDNIRLFNVVYELERNWRMYIMLEGIFTIVEKYPEFAVNQDKGYLLLEIVSKIAQELCLSNHKIACQWTNEKSFLSKLYYGDLSSVGDGDFVKIIRNSIVNMRKKFQYMKLEKQPSATDSELDKNTMIAQHISSQRSDKNPSKPGLNSPLSVRKRWQKFIKCIIKIIRYLSSISILSETDEQPVRKIILQLQHWFLISPTFRIKNLILQELLITTSALKSKQQAVKISQCIQIGSNLIYGYYDLLDSIGLTIIMKMMAGIKASKQQGKQFQQLEQVFSMSQKLYLEQKIVKNQKQFSTTIQAFVQCANSLLADLQQPTNLNKVPALGKHPSERYYRMIQYLLEKLNIVILQNGAYLFSEWNFLTGFWMSFCSNKNHEIQIKTIFYVGEVVQKLLEMYKDRQQQVISIYLQLSAKCTTKKDLKIEYQIISQIKNYIPLLQNQHALMQTFKIIKILQTQVKTSTLQKSHHSNQVQERKFMVQLSQLQQAFIKEGIFRIKKLDNLYSIISGIQVLGSQKNQQYKILTLLWTVADHLRNLFTIYQDQSQKKKSQYENLWRLVFQKIQKIADLSLNAQTKQSSIHTFTQIIAQNSPVIKDHLLIDLYENIFISKMFVSLFENFTRFKDLIHSADISFKVDMVKTATKNYYKLTKKFILQNIFEQPKSNVGFTLEKVVKYLGELNAPESADIPPVQIMYQFLVFVQKLIDKENIQFSYVSQDSVQDMIKQLDIMGQKIDQTTILWRKKYQPHFVDVKARFQKLSTQSNLNKILTTQTQINSVNIQQG